MSRTQRSVRLAALPLLLATMAAATGAEREVSEPRPRAVFESTEHDFGEQVPGKTLTHVFVVRNEGDAPLEIRSVHPECGCTVARFDRTIAPGESGEIHAELATLQLLARNSSRIAVETNDPDLARAILTLAVEVQSVLRANPAFARWIYVHGEQEGTIPQTVWARDGQEFQVVSVESSVPHVRTSFRPVTEEEREANEAGSQWRVELTLDGDAPVGPINGLALVHTDHPRQDVIPIELSGFVRPVVHVMEPPLASLELFPGLPHTLVYHVRTFATEPISVTEVESDLPLTETEIVAVEVGRRYDVRVTLDPDEMEEGRFTGKVVFHTDSPRASEVEVSLSGKRSAAPES